MPVTLTFPPGELQAGSKMSVNDRGKWKKGNKKSIVSGDLEEIAKHKRKGKGKGIRIGKSKDTNKAKQKREGEKER